MDIIYMKERSKNNRTIIINDDERSSLEQQICTLDNLNTQYVNSIVNADLTQSIDKIPNEIADLIIIDPPYNLTKNFNGLVFQSTSNQEYIEYLRTWFYKVCDKLKPNGTLYMCGDWKCTSALQTVMDEKLTILNRITWQREKGRGAKNNWKNGMEDIWFGVKNKNDYYFNVEAVKLKRKVLAPYKENGVAKDWNSKEDGNYRMTYPSNFWDDITIPFWSMSENTDHPTQKSEKLYAKLILASSKEGDLVFDPFLGSGTAAVVAKKLNRRYLGIEINKEYCLYALKRLNQADTDKTIQGYSDGIFYERNAGKKI